MVVIKKSMKIAAKTVRLGRDSTIPETNGMRFYEIAFFALVRFRANPNPNPSNRRKSMREKGSGTFLMIEYQAKRYLTPFSMKT